MTVLLHAMVIGDQPDDLRRMEALLLEAEETGRLPSIQIKFEPVPDFAAAIDCLAKIGRAPVDTLLLNLSSPDDLPRLAELRQAYPGLPVIASVEPSNESLALLAIAQGASDYWLHGQSNLRELASLFRHAVESARLAARCARLNWLEENIQEVLWRAQPNLRLIEVSSSVERLAGIPLEQALEMSLPDLFSPSDRQNLTDALADFYRPDVSPTACRTISLELEHLHRGGPDFWAEISFHAVRDAQGNLIGFSGSTRDVSDRHAIQDKLNYINLHDMLTGLFNRSYFEEELKRLEFSRLYPITVLIGDLEGLREINFEQGLSVGDELLKQVANILHLTFRSEDMIARIGGDEFIVIMPRTHARAAGKALQRVINLVENYNLEHLAAPMRLSLGVATAEQGQSLIETLKIAGAQKFNNKVAV